MTRKAALAFGIGASVLLAAGTASAAGTCASEVRDLQAQLGVTSSEGMSSNTTIDNNQVATQSGTGTSTTTTAPSAGTANAPDGANPMASGTDDSTTTQTTPPPATGSSSTTADTYGSSSNSSTTTTAPSVGTGNADDGANPMASGTSDSTGQPTTLSPTITETSRAGELNTSAGGRAEALAALKKAQLYADAGEEDACMAELNTAKQHMGVQ